MYRWPIRLRADGGDAEPLRLEVPPRGAAFTLPCLMHLGHPIHLALIDAYLRGAVPFPRGASLGWDSRAILANLVGPPVLLYGLGQEQATLADLLLLPPSREAAGHSRLIVSTPDGPAIRLACASARPRRKADVTTTARSEPSWHRVVAAVPRWDELRAHPPSGLSPAPITVVSQRPEDRAGREPTARADPRDYGHTAPSHARGTPSPADDPGKVAREVIRLLTRDPRQLSQMSLRLVWGGSSMRVSLTAEVHGEHTVTVLPTERDDVDSAVSRMESDDVDSTVSRMESAAWATLEALIEMPIEERRSEPIALRLAGSRRTTELAVGRSLVLPRNRRVFAAWLGSDGRVVIRLAAEGGRPVEGGRT